MLSLAGLACSLLSPARGLPTAAPTPRSVSSAVASSPTAPRSVTAPASAEPATGTPAAGTPTAVTPTALPSATATALPAASATALPSATATEAPLQLEVVQTQTWTDRQGNVRANFLVRNPYEFPVAPAYRANASLFNAAGTLVRNSGLYFLDGISGGNGFLLPGESVAANVCFTCETSPLPEAWSTIKFNAVIRDATSLWKYSTDVTVTVSSAAFSGDDPIFDVTGTAKNNGDSHLSRISMRVFVFDEADKLVGAAEASVDDVAPGATKPVRGYGIGQAPKGRTHYTFTALGVSY
jgi:hypothetical protein